MIILIDAGNTRVKAGWIDPDTQSREMVSVAFRHADLDQLAHWLAKLPSPPNAAFGVNVAGPAVETALGHILAPYECDIQWVTGEPQTLNVVNAYKSPEQLGPDRWLALLGLAQRPHPQSRAAHPDDPLCPLLLASFGTATTIDTLVVTQGHLSSEWLQYSFPGGLILPGPALMRTSLSENTARLPDATSHTTIYPTHTDQSIASGIAAAQAGAVLRQWLASLEYYGLAPQVFTTGGGWTAVKEEVTRLLHFSQARLSIPTSLIEWIPAPALDGLAALALQSHPSNELN